MTPTSWLREELLTLHPGVYAIWLLLAGALLVALLKYSFTHVWRYRLIEDTPTARVQTAPQGFVELEGRVAPLGPEPLYSPLRRMHCVWYSYRVEQFESGLAAAQLTGPWAIVIAFVLFVLHMFEVRRTSLVVDSGTSDEFFLIRDATGTCLVDPQDAQVVGAKTKVWTIGEHRYEESVIEVDQPIYALGLFRTHREHLERPEWQETEELIRDWRRDQRKLAARFDFNRDGKLDSWEWEAARLAAQDEVRQLRLQRGTGPELHVLCRPTDKRPFMLSLLRQQGLITHHWFRSVLSILGSLAVGILIIWSLTLRLPW
jgi:hypothetical protein